MEDRDADDLPSDPAQWPGGRAKHSTFGGGEGDHASGEGAEGKLGPAQERAAGDAGGG